MATERTNKIKAKKVKKKILILKRKIMEMRK